MSIYYLSADGCDSRDGLSPENAWRTIEKANRSAAPGDELRLRRGDTFFGHISLPAGETPDRPTVIGAFGEGKKPTVSQYKTILPDSWEEAPGMPGVWRVDLSDPSRYTGNVYQADTNVGFLLVSGKVYPRMRFDLSALTAPLDGSDAQTWDFICDDRYAYVRCPDARPDSLSSDIRLACNILCLAMKDNMRITDLVFDGTGGHGIQGSAENVYIGGCEFHNVGGSLLPGYPVPGTRYGNGVECWSDSSHITVENCRFTGIYDVAITMQGDNVRKSWTDMFFRNNLMWNCQQCFEVWSDGQLPDTGFVNCRFENNICVDSGYCWGYPVRPNKTASCHLLIYGLSCPLCDITVTGNIFSGARVCTVFKSGGSAQIPDDYRIFGNVILTRPGAVLSYPGNSPEEVCAVFEEKLKAENDVRILHTAAEYSGYPAFSE